MNLKEFLKPDLKKIILTIGIAFFSIIIFSLGLCGLVPCTFLGTRASQILSPILMAPFFILGESFIILALILSVIYWYILSCIIIHFYTKLRTKS